MTTPSPSSLSNRRLRHAPPEGARGGATPVPLPSPERVTGPPPTRTGPAAAEPTLAYAVPLADAAERMSNAERLDELWPQLVQEALTLIEADGAGIAEYRDRTWRPLAIGTGSGVVATDRFLAGIQHTAAQGLLLDADWSDDLDNGTAAGDWRSVLVVGVDRRPSRVPTRLVWFGERRGAFGAHLELADLLARHAGVAARAVTNRETLTEAVTSRHRVGQAQGIMMARYGVTAEQSFAALRLRSQHTNTKLRTLAEQVIATGGLPKEQRPG